MWWVSRSIWREETRGKYPIAETMTNYSLRLKIYTMYQSPGGHADSPWMLLSPNASTIWSIKRKLSANEMFRHYPSE
ncbi:hypothetical protein HNY73_007880 [Argiope bruennichi]|uniref:Uncharacterized protein n=1 Tax=Argiope bruennichi TaxID=94029 RepID=A0A8T0F717_ARGBR|nr:hypothetical protein HNY73_007880 [Argiope bruennichi]